MFGGNSGNALIGGYAGDGIVTLGLGFRFGNFALDATVSEEALRRGSRPHRLRPTTSTRSAI